MRAEYSSMVSSLAKRENIDRCSDSGIIKVCKTLNERINIQIKAILQTYQGNPLVCADFSADTFIQQLDPLLHQCIQVLTAPAREKRRLFPAEHHGEQHTDGGNKTMKQLYCLSTILYCTNPQCNMPFQYLLSDALLCLGGSTELFKIFNRIGAVASLDTHDRVATCAVRDRIAKGVGFELVPNTFTAVSIDNIDILQRHAMVSSTDTKRSWHGTSIQATQPLPKSIRILSELESTTTPQTTNTATQMSTSGKRYSSSPTISPIPTQVQKRQRTLREGLSSHTRTLVAGGQEISSELFSNMHESTVYRWPTISHFTLRNSGYSRGAEFTQQAP